MTIIRWIPASSKTSHALAHESARSRGGPTWAAKGLSDARTVFNVKIAAEGMTPGVAWMAFRMSFFESGEPVTIVMSGCGIRVGESRTSAVAV